MPCPTSPAPCQRGRPTAAAPRHLTRLTAAGVHRGLRTPEHQQIQNSPVRSRSPRAARAGSGRPRRLHRPDRTAPVPHRTPVQAGRAPHERRGTSRPSRLRSPLRSRAPESVSLQAFKMPLVPTQGTIQLRCRARIASTYHAREIRNKSWTVDVFHSIQLTGFGAMSEKFTDFFAHYFNLFSDILTRHLSH